MTLTEAPASLSITKSKFMIAVILGELTFLSATEKTCSSSSDEEKSTCHSHTLGADNIRVRNVLFYRSLCTSCLWRGSRSWDGARSRVVTGATGWVITGDTCGATTMAGTTWMMSVTSTTGARGSRQRRAGWVSIVLRTTTIIDDLGVHHHHR